jgi:uncharacterized membrane protein YbhN (UPF0104 family)
MSRRPVQILLSLLSLGAGAALVALLPHLLHTTWGRTLEYFATVWSPMLLLMVVLWFAGLWAYTFVFTASLPGLSHPHALALNVTGTAASNVLPFGGAVGVAITFLMARGWGHPRHAIAASALITGVWNVFSRLCLPLLGLLALLVTREVPNPAVTQAAIVAAVILTALTALVVAAVASQSAARRFGDWFDVLARLLPHRLRPELGVASEALERVQRAVAEVLKTGWIQLTLGMVAYMGLQAVLFTSCLVMTGAYRDLAQTLAAFALGRVLTAVGVTPNGVGISEAGTAALLVALGSPAAPVAAAVLLFSMLTHGLETLSGAVTWMVWMTMKMVRGNRVAPREG